MEKFLLCPRSEICPVYRIYVDNIEDDSLAIIQVSSIENQDFFGCRAFINVKKLAQDKKIPAEQIKRLDNLSNCMLIYEANRLSPKHMLDT